MVKVRAHLEHLLETTLREEDGVVVLVGVALKAGATARVGVANKAEEGVPGFDDDDERAPPPL